MSDFGDSLGSTLKQEYPGFTLGLEFSMPIGNSFYNAQKQETLADLLAVDYEIDIIKSQILKNLRQLYHSYLSFDKKISSNDELIMKLKYKLDKEKSRYQQARSDKLLLLRYQSDILDAKMLRLSTFFQKMEIASLIKFTCHAY